jgi:hypothetical protein
LLDTKSGNSSAHDRVELFKQYIELVGKERIGLVIGDPEFVELKWMKYLDDNALLSLLRLPKHHSIERLNGDILKVQRLVFKSQQGLLPKA